MPVLCWTEARLIAQGAGAAVRRVPHVVHHLGKGARHWMRHGPLQLSHHGARATWKAAVVCLVLVPPAALFVPPLVYPPVSYPPLPPSYVPAGALVDFDQPERPHPVPEPGTGAVLAGAVVMLAVLKHRKAR